MTTKKSTQNKEPRIVEVVASFSFKKNIGNFENLDYFCSVKEECEKGKEAETYRRLFEFCKTQVRNAAETPRATPMSKREHREKVTLGKHDADIAEGIVDFGGEEHSIPKNE